jgi:hypothetical protein
MARMKIFSASEEEACESPPVFNSAERKRFFSLPATLSESTDGKFRISLYKILLYVEIAEAIKSGVLVHRGYFGRAGGAFCAASSSSM